MMKNNHAAAADKKEAGRAYYQERLNRVVSYIHDHLDEELDLNRLADIACLSPCHWHRTYQAVYGETIAATVKRLRLHRAAGYLAHGGMPIEKIAEKSGYPNLQSFTRIFHSVYGMPPAQYRREGSHTRFHERHQERSKLMYEVRITTAPPLTVTAVDHTGPYMEIGRAFETLFGWLGMRGLIRPGLQMIGIYLDDPTSVPEQSLRSKAGVVLDEAIAIEAPLTRARVAGGEVAILRHKGPYADMRAAYDWLFGEWLLRSGRQAADAPVYEIYLNNPRDTAPTELLTDIYLPLKPE